MSTGGLFNQQPTPLGGGQSPLSTGGGMSGGFGGGQQTSAPSFAMPYLQQALGGGRQPQQQFAPFGSGRGDPIDPSMKIDRRLARGQMLGYDPGPQQPELSDVVGHFGDMQYRPQRYDPIAAEQNYYARMAQQYQQPPPMQNPSQYGGYTNAFNQSFGSPMGQFSRQLGIQPMSQEQFAQNAATAQNSLGGQQAMQPAYMQEPEFQGYQTQVQDLNRQMQDYIQKAPMYQQLQDLQGKMRGISSRFAQQRQQSMQQYNPYVRQMPQQYSNQGLAGLYAAFPQNFGRQQTYSTPRMAQIPQNFGREQTYANPSTYADYSSLRAPPAAAATAPASAAAVIDTGYYGYGTPFRKGGKV